MASRVDYGDKGPSPTMRLTVVVILVILAIGTAVAANWLLRRPPLVPPSGGRQLVGVGSARPAAFYLDMDSESKVRLAQRNLMRIASDEATRLGELKDEMALLMDDPNVVSWFAAEWHVRRGATDSVTMSAFADIFERVKRPEFLEPTKDLFRTDDPFLQGKAVQAAITQADPSLVDEIAHVYAIARVDTRSESAPFRIQCVQAARACGGPALPNFIRGILEDSDLVLRVEALQVARDLALPGLESTLKKLLDEPLPRMRLLAACALVASGTRSASATLGTLIDPMDPATTLEAASYAGIYKLDSLIPVLVRAMNGVTGEARRSVEIALARLRHGPTLDALRVRAADPHQDRGDDAVTALTAAAIPDDIPFLVGLAKTATPTRIRSICAGVTISQSAALAPVLVPVLNASPTYTPEMHDALKVVGDSVVDPLAEALRKVKSEEQAFIPIAWLGSVGTAKARAELLKSRKGPGHRLCDEQIRLIDLSARRLGR